MRLVQPENTACCGGGDCAWTAYPYCNVVTLGVTGVPVEATERARKDEGMKFVPLIEKKRVGRHVGHSAGDGPLYPETDTAGRRQAVTKIELTEAVLPRMLNHSVRMVDTIYTVIGLVQDDLTTAIGVVPPPQYVATSSIALTDNDAFQARRISPSAKPAQRSKGPAARSGLTGVT